MAEETYDSDYHWVSNRFALKTLVKNMTSPTNRFRKVVDDKEVELARVKEHNKFLTEKFANFAKAQSEADPDHVDLEDLPGEVLEKIEEIESSEQVGNNKNQEPPGEDG